MKTKAELEKELVDFLQKKQFLIGELNKLEGIIIYIQNELSAALNAENKDGPI
jgi:hypothetical protein